MLAASLCKIVLIALFLVFVCEFLVYYIAMLQCTWPDINSNLSAKPLKVMVLADPHLLGPKKGHWFDKLRREWQMHQAFQTVMIIHNPEVVFILGDLYDEGQWADQLEFEEFVKRFNYLFQHPTSTKLYAVAGNHDLGFHYRMTYEKMERFRMAFDAPSVNVKVIKGNIFVMVNSMALDNDGCNFCKSAMAELQRVSTSLWCRNVGGLCAKDAIDLPAGTKPILMQHFPMYRDSDVSCEGEDSAPANEKEILFKQKWDCLSAESSNELFRLLDPRLILNGHTHHGCFRVHRGNVPEWTVASFTWRNRNNPAFLLMSVTPSEHKISKCFLPRETSIVFIYAFGFCSTFLYFLLRRTCLRIRNGYRNKNR